MKTYEQIGEELDNLENLNERLLNALSSLERYPYEVVPLQGSVLTTLRQASNHLNAKIHVMKWVMDVEE